MSRIAPVKFYLKGDPNGFPPNTTYEALRDVSPLLGSRTGLSTGEDPMEIVATKLAELVAIEP